MDDHPQVKLEGLLDGKASVGFPAFDLKEGMYGIFSVQYETKRCGSSHGTCHTALRFTYEKGRCVRILR